jgi:ribosomal protein S3
MIKYGLKDMHLKKIRPKYFFVFLDAVIKNMPQVNNTFHTFRILVTGKLRGGTSRTNKYLAGFGGIPRQSLEKNVRYAFGDV